MKWGDQEVTVEGKLIRQLASGDFVLSDGKTEIIVELDSDIRLDKAIDQNTQLRLFGEYESRDKRLDVDYLQIM